MVTVYGLDKDKVLNVMYGLEHEKGLNLMYRGRVDEVERMDINTGLHDYLDISCMNCQVGQRFIPVDKLHC